MESISVALQIYGLGFIISFLIACMIKALLFVIRRFGGASKEAPNK